MNQIGPWITATKANYSKLHQLHQLHQPIASILTSVEYYSYKVHIFFLYSCTVIFSRSYILSSIVQTANIRIIEGVSGCLLEVKSYVKIILLSGPKSGRGRGRLQERWSFARGSNCKTLTGEVYVFWIGRRLY